MADDPDPNRWHEPNRTISREDRVADEGTGGPPALRLLPTWASALVAVLILVLLLFLFR